MELRDPETADIKRVRELVESTMTASYSLSPQQIEALLEDDFGEERLVEAFTSPDSVTLVAESTVSKAETTVGGIIEAECDEAKGEVQWLFVDPEHCGDGIGTQLFETALETLREQGAERITASTLEANREGDQFFERFGFEQVDDRQVEVAGESLVEYVYVEPSAETESAGNSDTTDESDAELPETETNNDITTATADDGQQVYIDHPEEVFCNLGVELVRREIDEALAIVSDCSQHVHLVTNARDCRSRARVHREPIGLLLGRHRLGVLIDGDDPIIFSLQCRPLFFNSVRQRRCSAGSAS